MPRRHRRHTPGAVLVLRVAEQAKARTHRDAGALNSSSRACAAPRALQCFFSDHAFQPKSAVSGLAPIYRQSGARMYRKDGYRARQLRSASQYARSLPS